MTINSDCGIYRLTSPSGKSYIGSSCKMKRRLRQHGQRLRRSGHENRCLQDAFRKYGELKEEILLVCRQEDLIMYEQICINGLGPAYNMSRLAGRVEMTEAIRAKISAANKRRVYSPEERAKRSANGKGKVHSAEARAKIGAGNRGKVRSHEARAKVGAANKGRVRTAEVRAKISEAGKGRVFTQEHRAKISAARKRYFAERAQP